MQMNSVPQHLLSEDRQEYERILDEALRSAPHRPELAAVGQRLNLEQLRTMALNATALITTAASDEYAHYVKVREELRRPVRSTPLMSEEDGSMEPGTTAMGLAATVGEVGETAGRRRSRRRSGARARPRRNSRGDIPARGVRPEGARS